MVACPPYHVRTSQQSNRAPRAQNRDLEATQTLPRFDLRTTPCTARLITPELPQEDVHGWRWTVVLSKIGEANLYAGDTVEAGPGRAEELADEAPKAVAHSAAFYHENNVSKAAPVQSLTLMEALGYAPSATCGPHGLLY